MLCLAYSPGQQVHKAVSPISFRLPSRSKIHFATLRDPHCHLTNLPTNFRKNIEPFQICVVVHHLQVYVKHKEQIDVLLGSISQLKGGASES